MTHSKHFMKKHIFNIIGLCLGIFFLISGVACCAEPFICQIDEVRETNIQAGLVHGVVQVDATEYSTPDLKAKTKVIRLPFTYASNTFEGSIPSFVWPPLAELRGKTFAIVFSRDALDPLQGVVKGTDGAALRIVMIPNADILRKIQSIKDYDSALKLFNDESMGRSYDVRSLGLLQALAISTTNPVGAAGIVKAIYDVACKSSLPFSSILAKMHLPFAYVAMQQGTSASRQKEECSEVLFQIWENSIRNNQATAQELLDYLKNNAKESGGFTEVINSFVANNTESLKKTSKEMRLENLEILLKEIP